MVNMLRRYAVSTALVVMAATLLVLGGGGDIASAQAGNNNTGGGNGMRISPLRQDLTVKPGESKTVEINVENITNGPAELRAVANDFVASNDESGIPRVLLNENDNAPSHGLRRYINKIDNFSLAPKERKTIKVTIKMPSDAAGGGYYGAVRFLPAANNANQNIALSASVGCLFLVTVPGDVKEQMQVESLNVSSDEKDSKAASFFTDGRNLKVAVRIKNLGNVQASPFGKVRVKKSGQEIGSYEINTSEPRGSVLPDSVRRFDIKLGDIAKGAGKYTVEGNFGYGNKGQLITANTTFYVVPLVYVLVGGALLLLIVLGAFVIPRMIRGHDRRLLKRMRGR